MEGTHDNNVTVFIMTCKMTVKPLYYIQLLFVKVSIDLKDIVNIAEDFICNFSITIGIRTNDYERKRVLQRN